MIEHIFPPEMMQEREKQLITALLDCAGVYYDINFTENRILGNPIQTVDGKHYPILELIGKQKNCSYTEILDYWADKMPCEEVEAFLEFSDIENIKARYAAGEHIIGHRFWTYDVLGNSMLAEQKIVLYTDNTSGDLLGLVYVSNGREADNTKQKEKQLSEQYREASHRASLLQKASVNVPGGYHRCAMDKGYPFLFISNSFEQIVGYTKEQIERELDNKFANLVIAEDAERLAMLERNINEKGNSDIAYRIRRRDGEIRWIQDSSLAVDWDGVPCLQCTIADITDFVHQQEMFAREKAEIDEIFTDIPCGYHRCTTDGGFKLSFVSDSFLETVGYTYNEVINRPYIDFVAPEDLELFMNHEPKLINDGRIELVYRIMRKDGQRRWIKDSTMRVNQSGKDYYQCILADITDFVNHQEEILKKNIELMQKENQMEIVAENMPGGYHRCRAEEGCPFIYIGDHFTDIVGYTKKEIEEDFKNLYRNLVWDEDISSMRTFEEMRSMRGKGNVYDTSVYRLKHKGGGYRWVTDSTIFVDLGEQSFFQASISDITEYIEGLNAAKKEAEASNLAKSTFLFNASHDIRTPMNAIQGFAHIIRENSSNEMIVRETVEKIQAASNTLMTLMNDILDLSRIERGKEEINLEAMQLSEFGSNLYELFAESMQSSGIDLCIKGEVEHSEVLCDKLKMTRIGMNMLSNARKFTQRGGSVRFGVEELGFDGKCAEYRFYARDTGIGMSEEFKKRAFDQFERERTSTESGVSGSGLGLSIIKRLVDLMGGRVEIESELGKGTEISVYLKLEIVSYSGTELDRAAVNDTDMSGKRVLLVEDNDFNREIAKYILDGMGFEVDEATNGSMCLDKVIKADEGFYDAVLMDIQMPIMDGYTAAREIRSLKDRKKAAVPIIAMTANAFDEDKQKCLDVGMNGHIGKPLDIEVVLKELQKVIISKE